MRESKGVNLNEITTSNRPLWLEKTNEERVGFQEQWILKFQGTGAKGQSQSLELRFHLLSSLNGFKRVAEVSGLLFVKEPNGDLQKHSVRQSFELSKFRQDGDAVQFGKCTLSDSRSTGSITAKGSELSWNLKFENARPCAFDTIPPIARKLRTTELLRTTIAEDLVVSGEVRLGGLLLNFQGARGMQAHWASKRLPNQWLWAHSNHFVKEDGSPSDLVFEGIVAKTPLLASALKLELATFFVRYDGIEYAFKGAWNSLFCRQTKTGLTWKFRIERGDILFQGEVAAQHKLSLSRASEDTDGSILFSVITSVADCSLSVYRRGKLEATYLSRGATFFEEVTRDKNPYVSDLD